MARSGKYRLGHIAKGVYLIECNFIRDDMDLYTACLFTLNTPNGYLIAKSTNQV